jgi:hypothetical protein
VARSYSVERIIKGGKKGTKREREWQKERKVFLVSKYVLVSENLTVNIIFMCD